MTDEFHIRGAIPSDYPHFARLFVELALDLAPGHLAVLRPCPGRELVRLRDPASPDEYRTGFMSFERSFPGAYPFRARTVEHATTLIEWACGQVPSDAPYIQVFVEGNDELVELLLANGAWVNLLTINMAGSLAGTR